jgi:exoribonuclease-2
VVRGKPETFNRPDYNFKLDRDGAERPSPTGDETRRTSAHARRGAPLDLIVAEAMILANSTWGGWLAEQRRARHLPQPGQPGARHEGAHGHEARCRMPASGVAQYAWATSPLRRYVDLVNQWQIIACARHGRTARAGSAVQARRTPRSSPSSRAFDAAYTAYNDFQSDDRALLDARAGCSRTASTELDATRDEGRPGARRDACHWSSGAAGTEDLPRGAPRARPRRGQSTC